MAGKPAGRDAGAPGAAAGVISGRGVERVLVLACDGLDGPGREQAGLAERVVAAITGFCPRVEVVRPGMCALGTRGPARYFGGEASLAGQIVAAVTALGVTCRAGVADGLFAATLAAVPPGGQAVPDEPVTVVAAADTAGFLAPFPVTVLDDPDLAGLLRRLGIRTLGDLAGLPEHDVASRFGEAGEVAHRLARGLDSRPLDAPAPAQDLSAAQEFDPPETRAEPLVFAAKALAEQMLARLAASGLTCVRVEVTARWDDGREHSRLWRHDGLLSAVHLADRVRWQLDGWQAGRGPGATGAGGVGPGGVGPGGAGPGGAGSARADEDGTDGFEAPGGVVLLRLTPDQVVHATGRQFALWGETVVSDRVARAAMRIQALLGHEAVLRPVPGGGRDAAEQVTLGAFGEVTEPRRPADQPWPGQIPGTAPAIVYPEPRKAAVTDAAGQPVTVSGRCVISAPPAALAVDGEPRREVTAWAGPWPLAERWWEPDQARRRARFQLLTGDGRAWLASLRDGSWQVEGAYW